MFCRLQPNAETKSKQLLAWKTLILDYFKSTKQTVLDINEAQRSPLFSNSSINRKLPLDAITYVLEDMAKTGNAAPIDKSKMKWEIYWHSLDEWGNMIYGWASDNGMNNTVCTLFEIVEGDNSTDQGNLMYNYVIIYFYQVEQYKS